MPQFINPFTFTKYPRNLTRDEAARALRLSIAAEYEAIQLYTQIAESLPTELDNVKKLYRSISREEQVHAGEFLEGLRVVDPEEFEAYRQGAAEARDILGMVNKLDQIFEQLPTI